MNDQNITPEQVAEMIRTMDEKLTPQQRLEFLRDCNADLRALNKNLADLRTLVDETRKEKAA